MAQRHELRQASPTHGSKTSGPQKEFGFDNLGVCAIPGDFVTPSPARRNNKNEQESIGAVLQRVLLEHQLGLSLNFVLLLGLTYALFPSLRPTAKAFFSLSYPHESGHYGQGPKDLYLVGGCVIYFTALRAVLLDYILTPLAHQFGIKKRKAKARFVEQSYQLLYYTVYCTWGVYLFLDDTPAGITDVNSLLISLWKDFPRLFLSPGMKLYYLTQLAFWMHQIVVIHLEERRKDHYQMLSHHFITVGLMVGSYGYRQWRVGNAILVCMDVVDWVFALAKILRYLNLQTACDCAFGAFVIVWIATRHIAYGAICWSIYAHVPTEAHFLYGVYSTSTGERLSSSGGEKLFENLLQPILRPKAETFAFNVNVRNCFLVMLFSLQCITIAWLFMIMRVVIRVLKGQGADDSRSDDEGAEDEIESGVAQPSAPLMSPAEVPKPRFIEVETTSEDTTWSYMKASNASGNSSGMSRKKSKGISSGLNLGEHKDILNRIGCLSEEQLAREREKREGSSSPRPPSSSSGGKR